MLPIVFPVQGPTNVRNTWNNTRPVYAYDASGRRHTTGALRPHHGIDLVTPRGTPIVSATPGEITHVWNDSQGRPQGNAVQIRDPDGWYHLYAHMLNPPDPQIIGWQVRAGQYIGRVGMTGSAEGPHLHYQISMTPGGRNDRVNPFDRLRALHVAHEARETNADLRALTAVERAGQSARMHGWLGDDGLATNAGASAVDLNARESAMREDMERPARPARTRRPAGAEARSAQGGARGMSPLTRAQAEEAREAVRALWPSVQRAYARLDEQGLQTRLARVIAPERAGAIVADLRRVQQTANPFMNMIASNIANAQRFPDEQWSLWVPTWLMLSSVARMLESVATPLESVAAARDDSVIGPILRYVSEVVDIYEDVQRGMDDVTASVREIRDDVAEAPSEAARAIAPYIPDPPSAGGIALVIIGAAAAIGVGFGLSRR